jgi:hypothetical protein
MYLLHTINPRYVQQLSAGFIQNIALNGDIMQVFEVLVILNISKTFLLSC